MTQPLDRGWVFCYIDIVKTSHMTINPFNRLFSSIEDNSKEICIAQLTLMERQFIKLEKTNPEDARALAQEYAEWLDDTEEDMGFMYMANLSELLN